MDSPQENALFKVVSPTEVWYCDRPLKSPGAVPKKISVAELEKIVGGGFRYSEDLYCKDVSRLPFTKTIRTQPVLKAILTRLQKPLMDKMVICKIDDEVGYGVFAREHIGFGEVVAIYAGELLLRSDLDDSTYSFDPGQKTRSDYRVEAKKIGGVARFFQHLPHHPDLLTSQRLKKYRADIRSIERNLDLDGTLGELNPQEAAASLKMLAHDVKYGKGQETKKMINYKRDPNAVFEVDNIRLTNIEWEKIATANLGMCSLVLKNGGSPILYFYAENDISPGDPMGFTYGLGYWSGLGKLPLLFDLSGNVLSRDFYKYTKMPIVKTIMDRACMFFYERKQYDQDKLKQEAVQLQMNGVTICTQSFFSTRKILAQNNIMSLAYLPSIPDEFVQELKKILPNDVEVEIFQREPEAKDPVVRNIYDVVCRSITLERWDQLTLFIRRDPIIEGCCVAFMQSQEVIIRDINPNREKLAEFLRLNAVRAQAFFEKTPTEELPLNIFNLLSK